MVGEEYLRVVRERVSRLKKTAEDAIAQVSDSNLFWKEHEGMNSIAVLVKHMSGNMISRWTDFLTTDGEKPNRNREGEFCQHFSGRHDMMQCWESGWNVFLNELSKLTPDDLLQVITIREEEHTVIEAIERQSDHYAYHVGQIVFIAKLLVEEDWKTLTIARVEV